MSKLNAASRRHNPRAATKPSTSLLPTPPLTPAQQKELNTKRRGELAEIAFLHKAADLGFRVSRPYGDSDRYDFITDFNSYLSRVQVKCTTQLIDGSYHLNAHRRIYGKAVPYNRDEIDFFAALVVPEDSWFIIPVADVLGITSFMLRPKFHPRDNRYSRYREAWTLLCQPAHDLTSELAVSK